MASFATVTGMYVKLVCRRPTNLDSRLPSLTVNIAEGSVEDQRDLNTLMDPPPQKCSLIAEPSCLSRRTGDLNASEDLLSA
eukprot:2767725-Rhodomonas_salina.1